MARRHPFRGSKVIKRELRLTPKERTVRRRLKEGGLPRRVARQKPLLNQHHREIRVAWCNERLHWRVNDWKRVIWSDERTFRLGSYGRVWVSRPVGRAYHPKYVTPAEEQGPSVQIWACFSGKGYGPCQIFEGTMNSGRYIEILNTQLLPYLRSHWRRHADVFFQQDNATPHTAQIVQDWMVGHRISLLPWPAKSADLNPMENIWSYLARKVEATHPRTVPELTAAIAQAWDSLDQDLINSLISSLPQRLQEVIDNDGYFSKY